MGLEDRFEGIADKATANWDNSQETQSSTQDFKSPDDQSQRQNQSLDAAPGLSNEFDTKATTLNQTDKQPTIEQQLADLSKFDKVKLPDGSEMTRDELTRAIMRQKDYTQKTQELSRQRQEFDQLRTQFEQQNEQAKYENNYAADLKKVLADPGLFSEFLRTYPREYHSRIQKDLQRYGAQEQYSQNRLDPVLAQSLQKQHELESNFKALQDSMNQERTKAWDAQMDALESKLSVKYPKGNMAMAYSSLQSYCEQNGLTIQNTQPGQVESLFEKFMKDSHEQTEKQYQEWAKEQSKQQIEANKKGSDIGRGGGTPNAPAPKTKLKDIDMYAAMKAAGAL